jgi:3-dehydroquinate dehydratase-1
MTGDVPHHKFLDLPGPMVVGTVHNRLDIDFVAAGLPPECVDLLEYRLDALVPGGLDAAGSMGSVSCPVIITARDPAEGGEHDLDEAARLKILERHLPAADAVDLELRSRRLIQELTPVLHDQGKALILSFHDFGKTPPTQTLQDRTDEALEAGAHIVKMALFLKDIDDLARLIAFVSANKSIPLSAMGMGPLGPASRLLLAQHGSRLNYGYLSHENAPGQWPADALKSAISRFGPIL